MVSSTTKPVSLDPRTFKTDPYEADHVPLPSPEELKRLGIYSTGGSLLPSDEEGSIQIGTRAPKAIVFAMDRLVERRVSKITNRSEFVRTAVVNLVLQLSEELESGHLKMTVKRLEMQRRAAAEAMLLHDIADMAATTRRVATLYVASDSGYEAVKALRNAKRYMEEAIPGEALRAQFINKVFGSKDGRERPEGWEGDEVGVLWNKVLEGELDRDDEEEVQGKAKLG